MKITKLIFYVSKKTKAWTFNISLKLGVVDQSLIFNLITINWTIS